MQDYDKGPYEMHVTGRGTGKSLSDEFQALNEGRQFSPLGVALRSVVVRVLDTVPQDQNYEFDAYAKIDNIGEPLQVELKITLSRK